MVDSQEWTAKGAGPSEVPDGSAPVSIGASIVRKSVQEPCHFCGFPLTFSPTGAPLFDRHFSDRAGADVCRVVVTPDPAGRHRMIQVKKGEYQKTLDRELGRWSERWRVVPRRAV